MFKKLRNRLILINFGITTFVIVVVFATIYIISTRPTAERQHRNNENSAPSVWGAEIDSDGNGIPDEFDKIFDQNMEQERDDAARRLLITLVTSGVAIEVVVVIVSYLMAEEAIKPVKDAYNAQKIFIANASHEIKTPLAAIAANLEAADIHDNKWISNVELETERLTKLNTELLNLARTDLMNKTVAREVDLKKEILKQLESFAPRMKDFDFKTEILISKKVKVNKDDFMQIFSILMDNAIKYTKKKIILEVSNNRLALKNDGAKIPAKKLPHIFERFYQVDKSRDGVGLGLSIAKALADKNKWKLTAESKDLTTFMLDF